MQPVESRGLGKFGLVVVVLCLVGTVQLLPRLYGESAWGVLHNHFGALALGLFSVLASAVIILVVVLMALLPGFRPVRLRWFEILILVALLLTSTMILVSFIS